MSDTEWRDYAKEKPNAGVCEWRVPSCVINGLFIIVAAHMRLRNAGYGTVLSPHFDHWDGYNIILPDGMQWRHTSENLGIKSYEVVTIAVEGLELSPCIYCKKTPKLEPIQRAYGGGVIVANEPHKFNAWCFKCCAWGNTPTYSDPREIERVRRHAIATALNEFKDKSTQEMKERVSNAMEGEK